jgi:taurine dioxygenase
MIMAYTITPLTEHTGAEIRGLDLSKPVDAETRAALNAAFAKHHVLVVRDQTYDPADFKRAVQLWGELQPHDKKDHHIPGFPEMYYVTNQEFLGDRRMIPGRDLPHRSLEPPGAAQGDDPLPGGIAEPRRRHAIRQHAFGV